MKWAITSEAELEDPKSAVERDEKLLEQVGAEKEPATLRIWRTTKSIAVPRHFSLNDRFPIAERYLKNGDWPVVLRSSGGSAMPQGPGIVNISMIFPHDRSMSIDAVFQMLTDPLIDFCDYLGFSASVGAVPGSFCDGSYNLVVNQQKLAGTAQRRKKHAVLAHAALQVELDLVDTCCSINYLNEQLGREERCRPEAATTLLTVLGKDVSVADVVRKLQEYFTGEKGAS